MLENHDKVNCEFFGILRLYWYRVVVVKKEDGNLKVFLLMLITDLPLGKP